MAEISKITLPSGNTYDLKDAIAREMIAGGITFIVAWNGTSAPVAANIPSGVVVNYEGTSYTGTLAAADAQVGAFYLVKSSTQTEVLDIYDEYVVITVGTAKSWEKLGDTQIDISTLGALAYKDNVTLSKGSGDNVLGEATTFTAGTSSVTFAGGTTDKVLGVDTTFGMTQPTISVTPSTTNIKATASGTAVGANGTASAITGFGAHTTDSALGADATFTTTVTPTTTRIKATASGTAVGADGTAAAITGFGTHSTETFVKSVSAETSNKLVTTSITGVNGTATVSKVTSATHKLATTSVPNVTSAGSASTWTFSMGTGTDAETLIISGDNSTAPTLGTPKVVATGGITDTGSGTNVVTAINIIDTTVAKAATSATTVATGAVSTTGSGSAVVTGVTIGDSAAAITALGTPTTSNCLTGVKVTAQPTIALATGASSGTGVISVATGITSASTTANDKDEVTAITALGTPTTSSVLTGVKVTAQPTIALATGATAGTGVVSVATGISSASASGGAVTVGTDDQVTAVTSVGTGTAAAQTITVGTNDKVKVAKYNNLGVTVS